MVYVYDTVEYVRGSRRQKPAGAASAFLTLGVRYDPDTEALFADEAEEEGVEQGGEGESLGQDQRHDQIDAEQAAEAKDTAWET